VVVEGRTIAGVWEKAVRECWENGIEVPTEYGEKAKEITLLMVVEEPFGEPRIHRGDVYAVVGLREYLEEVLYGNRDKLVEEGKLPYTYHQRLFNFKGVNQIDYVVEKLKKVGYTRRAQAITWDPLTDPGIDSPPCLQRLWFKIYGGELVMQSEWRSRDLFRAAHMNMLAMTELQRMVAERIGVKVGAYSDFSNSAHIYEKSYPDVERFLRVARKRGYTEGTKSFRV